MCFFVMWDIMVCVIQRGEDKMESYEEKQSRSIQGIVTGVVTENRDPSGKHPGMVKADVYVA